MTKGSAPAMDCTQCTQTIGKTASHYVTGGQLLCFRCMDRRGGHAGTYPDCPEDWHDLWDHLDYFGTRAAVASTLGLWP